jgi:hypothetical protein
VTTIVRVSPIAVTINQGTAIGQGAQRRDAPTLTNAAADPSSGDDHRAVNPFSATGNSTPQRGSAATRARRQPAERT